MSTSNRPLGELVEFVIHNLDYIKTCHNCHRPTISKTLRDWQNSSRSDVSTINSFRLETTATYNQGADQNSNRFTKSRVVGHP